MLDSEKAELDLAFRVLETKGWFSEIGWKFQSAIKSSARAFSAGHGQEIFHVGDAGAGLFGVASGSLLLGYPRDDGVQLPVVTVGSGFWLGDLAALSRQPGLVSIEVREDVTGIHVPARQVRHLTRNYPEIFTAFYRLSRINLHLAMRLLAAQSAETATQKVALRLVILSDYAAQDGGWIPVSNDDLSVQLGLSVPTIQRAVKRLADQGFIERGYARIRVLKPDYVGSL